jgi:hypothetical protein
LHIEQVDACGFHGLPCLGEAGGVFDFGKRRSLKIHVLGSVCFDLSYEVQKLCFGLASKAPRLGGLRHLEG